VYAFGEAGAVVERTPDLEYSLAIEIGIHHESGYGIRGLLR
jgi:hypothetical protein